MMVNLIVGMICLALGAWGVMAWWDEFGAVLRGLLPVVFLLVGLAAVGAGMRRKGACKSQKKEEERVASGDDASAVRYREPG